MYTAGLRSYSPRLGRWINRDPIGEQGGVNIYGFVENKPSLAIDSFGFFTLVLAPPRAVSDSTYYRQRPPRPPPPLPTTFKSAFWDSVKTEIRDIHYPNKSQREAIDKAYCMANYIAKISGIPSSLIKPRIPAKNLHVGNFITPQDGMTIPNRFVRNQVHVVIDSSQFPPSPLGDQSIFWLARLGFTLMHESVHYQDPSRNYDKKKWLQRNLNDPLEDTAGKLFAEKIDQCCTYEGVKRRISNRLQLVACKCGVPVGEIVKSDD